MIPARKVRFFVRWFTGQVEKRIRKTFRTVHVRGVEPLRDALLEHPVLIVSNHTSWWDPMLCILLCHGVLKCDAFAMMDAKNLRRLPFLGRVGGFGFHLDDPDDRKRVLRYSVDLLSRPGRLVWVFPQGKEMPRAALLDNFKPGAAIISRKAKDAKVFPVGIRYEFRNTPYPEAFLSIGAPLDPVVSVEQGCRLQQDAVQAELDTIDAYIAEPSGDTAFSTLFRRPSETHIERFAQAFLTFITRYGESPEK